MMNNNNNNASKKIQIFDSTLRDGVQGEGINFSVSDKINIVKALDELGVGYIEAGNPGSNPKDLEFFEEVKGLELKRAKIVAFGSTRRRNILARNDSNCRSLLSAGTDAVAIFGKSWDLHVEKILGATLEENLNMIRDTVSFFKDMGKEVVFDAEHFFDGYKNNPDYALMSLRAACEGGADCLALCETNGGAFPDEVYEIVKAAAKEIDVPLGIHCHNDSGCAAANSIMAVKAGCSQVQGTYLGYGERCGNANLSTIIPGLQLKLGYDCIPEENMTKLTQTARLIAEIANDPLYKGSPYVGRSAFSHKAGMHIDGVNKLSKSFEHIPPDSVGNERRFLMSEVAGRSTVLKKINKIAPELTKDSEQTQAICDAVKRLEYDGYSFEAADASFELLVREILGTRKEYFKLDYFKAITDEPAIQKYAASALIKVSVGDKTEITAAEGDGPVHALDTALRKALAVFYPQLKNMQLIDYKVRVLEDRKATASKVRVLIDSSDGLRSWSTVGVSTDVIEASWKALVEAAEYKLLISERSE